MHNEPLVVVSRSGALLFVAMLSGSASLGCGSSTSTTANLTAPSDNRCQATVTASPSSFPTAGGTGTVSVGVSRECAWRATSSSAWVAITSGAEGQGDGLVTFRVAENGDPVTRQAQLTVSERPVSIAQAAAPCHFEIDPSSAGAIGAAGGAVDIAVRAHSACSWSARAEVAWAGVTPSQGRGDGAVRVSVQPNPGPSRLVSAEIAGQRFSATQDAAGTPAPPAPTPPAPDPPAPTPPTPAPPAPPPPAPPPPAPVPTVPITLEGAPSDVTGTCPSLTFQLRTYTVYTTAETEFRKGPCRDVARTDEIKVEGMLMSDGRVRADRLELKK